MEAVSAKGNVAGTGGRVRCASVRRGPWRTPPETPVDVGRLNNENVPVCVSRRPAQVTYRLACPPWPATQSVASSGPPTTLPPRRLVLGLVRGSSAWRNRRQLGHPSPWHVHLCPPPSSCANRNAPRSRMQDRVRALILVAAAQSPVLSLSCRRPVQSLVSAHTQTKNPDESRLLTACTPPVPNATARSCSSPPSRRCHRVRAA